jgi:hypothetical protein
MQCPACAAELKLAERVPETLYKRYVYVRCPKCNREMVASMPRDDTYEPRLMTVRDAFREGSQDVKAKNSVDGDLAKITAGASCACGVIGGAVLALSATPIGGVFVLVSGAVCGGIVYGGWVLDNMIGSERWLQTLPRVALVFAATPEGYRA